MSVWSIIAIVLAVIVITTLVIGRSGRMARGRMSRLARIGAVIGAAVRELRRSAPRQLHLRCRRHHRDVPRLRLREVFPTGDDDELYLYGDPPSTEMGRAFRQHETG